MKKFVLVFAAALLVSVPGAAFGQTCGQNDGPNRNPCPAQSSTSKKSVPAPSMQMSSGSALTMMVAAPGHSGDSPFTPKRVTDSRYINDVDNGLDTGCTFREGGPLKIKLPIKRYLGELNGAGTIPTAYGDIEGAGTLRHAYLMERNGLIGRYATLRIPVYDIDFSEGERDRILFNGVDIGAGGSPAYLSGADGTWKVNEFQIPIEIIHFSNKGSSGNEPAEAQNEIEIRIDEQNQGWCMSADWVELSIDAASPVIMIHGNNSSGKFFTDLNFTQPFEQQKIAFDNTINMVTDSIVNHSAFLANRIPAIAREFGAHKVHLIAHSKGGLDTRDFLARKMPDNFAVLSFTTLSTPHHGSVGADYSLDSNDPKVSIWASDNKTRATLAWKAGTDKGTPDLRTSTVTAFNLANRPLLPKSFNVDGETKSILYFTIGGDANIDDSHDPRSGKPTITSNSNPQLNELRGIDSSFPWYVPTWGREFIMTQLYQLMGEVSSTTVARKPNNGKWFVKEFPTNSFQFNDFLVTANSAKLPEASVLYEGKFNHASVATPETAERIISRIRAIR